MEQPSKHTNILALELSSSREQRPVNRAENMAMPEKQLCALEKESRASGRLGDVRAGLAGGWRQVDVRGLAYDM